MARPLTAADVAVAIATCGRPDALHRCLAALAGGSERPGAVVVVDQAPSSRAREIVMACGLPARYVEQTRRGLSASRNRGLAETSGAVLAVTDDDCVPDPHWVRTLVAAFARDPRPTAVTGRILALGPPAPGLHAISLREGGAAVDHRGRRTPWQVGSGGNFAAWTATLRAQGGWDERLGAGSPGRAAEDLELLDRLLGSGELVRYDPAVVVRHERQDAGRRLASRWSYGYGVGALVGLLARRRDGFAARVLAAYVTLHLRGLRTAARDGDAFRARQHTRALAALGPGALYGLRAGLPR
ncbi:MAG: hypothetical protein QOK21_2825 [Solirubrobacteraceae bacterium]|nr:hypothetical protein [Solirubrobacteraceae bacterium]